MVMKPAQNPLFVSHPDLARHYERFEGEALADTNWLWQPLDDSAPFEMGTDALPEHVGKSWGRMHYHGLALFFVEIAQCFAYFQALLEAGVDSAPTLLFHGNNAVPRMASCWDRMGFILSDLFDLHGREDEVCFGKAVEELCGRTDLGSRKLRLFRGLKRVFDQDKELRTWRHKYVHRYGEHYKIDRPAGNVTVAIISWSSEERAGTIQELSGILPRSFSRLAEAMKTCSELTA